MTKYFYWWVWQGWRLYYSSPHLVNERFGSQFIDDKAYDMLKIRNERQ